MNLIDVIAATALIASLVCLAAIAVIRWLASGGED
jgi:hypothetical protein